MNQLLTAKDYNTAGTLVKEYTYTYDTYGNIRTSSNGTTTHTYTYGDAEWLDLLTAYDGVTIAYDSIGNPTNYYNGTNWAFTWRNGRELNTATSGSTSLSFAYDQNRVRTAKTAGNVTHKYYYAGGKLLRETWTQAGTTYVLDFLYDQNGRPYALKYTAGAAAAVTYYYVLNLQGDVIRLVDSTGATVASYDYDPWGKLLSVTDAGGNAITSTTHIANINPLRYRGYYYDSEIGFYYLQSRYYDPQIGRFINADSYASTGQGYIGFNMFAYCGNNPASRYDASGHFWDDLKEIIRTAIHAGHDLLNNALQPLGVNTAMIGAPFLDMYADENGIYHADSDCWQQHFGYNDLYDVAFDIGTYMESDKFKFTHNGESYIIWVWKGDYINFGTGAELGIYYGGEPHWRVDRSLALPMSLTLQHKGATIISYDETTWWLTGFNPNVSGARPGDLTAIYTINFSSNKGMYYSFYGYHRYTAGWTFDPIAYTATFTF